MKKNTDAWDERVAKERPNARSQPKFPWQVKPTDLDQQEDQEDQLSITSTEKEPVTGTKKVPVTGAKKVPVTKNVTGTEKVSDTEKVPVATFRIPHQELDYLFRNLAPGEFKLYLRLYRLSHGWGQEICRVGDNNLLETLNMSKNALRSAKRALMDKKLIKVVRVVNLGPKGFTEYQVSRAGEEINKNWYQKGTSTKKVSDTKKDPIKEDHDDDYIKKDHQRETMMIYESITKNSWKKADEEAYQKIKAIPLEKIKEAIQLVMQRSASRPNSLNYFIKEILNLTQPSEQSKAQRKKALEQIVSRVRQVHVGAANYTLPDLVEDVKRMAAREGVLFDNDLFNQIMGF
jgi:hypothetical protein